MKNLIASARWVENYDELIDYVHAMLGEADGMVALNGYSVDNFPGLAYIDGKGSLCFATEATLRALQDVLLRELPGDLVAKAVIKMAREHAGQVDRGGAPYVLHPMEVAHSVLRAGGSEEEVAAALLHDVVEDSPTTEQDLRFVVGFPDTVVDAVMSVTKQEGEARMEYASRVAKNHMGTKVKMADIKHNLDVTRLGSKPLEKKDLDRVQGYHMQLLFLKGAKND